MLGEAEAGLCFWARGERQNEKGEGEGPITWTMLQVLTFPPRQWGTLVTFGTYSYLHTLLIQNTMFQKIVGPVRASKRKEKSGSFSTLLMLKTLTFQPALVGPCPPKEWYQSKRNLVTDCKMCTWSLPWLLTQSSRTLIIS